MRRDLRVALDETSRDILAPRVGARQPGRLPPDASRRPNQIVCQSSARASLTPAPLSICHVQGRRDQSAEPCPRCSGQGYEPCMCTRWSDGDAGCSTCSKTGYMPCRSCRGGGTAIPVFQAIRKTDGDRGR